jgi:hypothetical protein
VELPQPVAGQPVQQGGEERPVGRGEPGFVDLTLQDGELVAQRKNLDVLVHIAHRQQPYEGEHARERQVGQSQQHDGSSWRTRLAAFSCIRCIRELAGHSPWMAFSAPTAWAWLFVRGRTVDDLRAIYRAIPANWAQGTAQLS